MIAYLACPIDDVETTELESLHARKREANADLVRHGFAVYDPIAPFTAPGQGPEGVVDINNLALSRSDVLLVVWPTRVVSVGVPMEIFYKHQEGGPIAVVGRQNSLQLKGMGVPTFDSIRQAVGWLFKAYTEELRVVDEATKIAEQYTFKQVVRPLKWTGDAECAPTQGYAGDAGFDLYVSETTEIVAGGWADVGCGISVEFPEGTWGMVYGRSSSWRKKRVRVEPGIIDNGYRGPLFAACQNVGDMAVTLERGDRVAQLIPFPLASQGLTLERVAELSQSTRGDRAFGSTGR